VVVYVDGRFSTAWLGVEGVGPRALKLGQVKALIVSAP
jgi:hypothetical protein